ncbi:MAG: glycosyltransferase family 2 protein [Gemmatimonadota bacterium]
MSSVLDCFVSIVAPLRNDGRIIEPFVLEVMRVLRGAYANYELVLVDDGSRDDTVSRVEELLAEHECIRLLRLSRSFGEEAAISAGLDTVIGDFVVVMLPHSDPPEMIPELVGQARGGSEIIFGVRDDAGDPLWMRAGRRLFYAYCRRVLRLDLPGNTSQFRVLSRRAVNAVLQIKDRYRYLRVLSAHVGFGSRSFVYQPLNRAGKTHTKTVREAVNLAIDLTVTASRRPLRVVTWFGALASLLDLGWAAWVLLGGLADGAGAQGWTTISLQLAVMFLFLFLILTVLSEYVGHILVESQGRPLYHVLEERTSSRLVVDADRTNVVTESPSLESAIRQVVRGEPSPSVRGAV